MTQHSLVEKIANWATIVMCICVTAAALHFVLTLRSAMPNARQENSKIPTGTRVELPDGPEANAAAMVLVAVSSRCRFCTESMPFYRRLAMLPEVQKGQVKVGFVGLQNAEETRKYAEAHGVSPDLILPLAVTGLRITATPTIVLVGPDKKVHESWVGYLGAEQEQLVEGAIRSLVEEIVALNTAVEGRP